MRSLRAIARRGNSTAALICGCVELYGWDWPKFQAAAKPWLELGAQSEDPLALFLLAYCTSSLDSEKQHAIKMAEKAANGGLGEAATFLGSLLEQNSETFAESEFWFKKGASLGDPWAYYYLGLQHSNKKNINFDEEKSREHWANGASMGHSGCMLFLGTLFISKNIDVSEGVRLVNASATAGNVYAMIDVASFHRFGLHGVPVNALKACELDKAALANMEAWDKQNFE